MLKDYKFDPQIKTAGNVTRWRNRLLLASLVLLIIFALTTRLVDIDVAVDAPAQNPVQDLALPGQALTTTPLPLPVSAESKTTEPETSVIELKTAVTEPEAAVTETEATALIVTNSSEAAPKTEEITPPSAPVRLVTEHEIKSGESLAAIFADRNLSPNLLHRIVHSSKTAGRLARIRPGQTLRFETDESGELLKLTLQRNRINSLHITANGSGFDAEEITQELDVKTAETVGFIQSSLFVDGQKADLSDGQIMELAGLFGWDIDFALELRVGDRFSVIYEEQYLDGEKYANGPIIAAEFINQGKKYRAIRYIDSNDNVGYYDEDGRAKRRTFIRTPLKFARVSSGFTTRRWHPVLKKWRSHKGTDYAANTGTPVKTTGNGKVTFRGRKGGYGNVVFVQHGGTYTTVYAHLSKFSKKARKGKKVKQGDVIGYVGSTGLASGPHLHYEFRVNGVHRNPLTVKLPKSQPLPKTELIVFKLNSKSKLAQLDHLSSSTMVASAVP